MGFFCGIKGSCKVPDIQNKAHTMHYNANVSKYTYSFVHVIHSFDYKNVWKLINIENNLFLSESNLLNTQ